MTALVKQNYQVGALILDAIHFVPQSRPRLFIVAAKDAMKIPEEIILNGGGGWNLASRNDPQSIQEATRRYEEEMDLVAAANSTGARERYF